MPVAGSPVLVDSCSCNSPLRRSRDLWAEHDLAEMEESLREVVELVPPESTVGFASAMHGLVLLDKQGEPISNALSWADMRASTQARWLKAIDPQAHQRTGTPVHPMAWPAKLAWVREERPELWGQVARVSDLKAYLLERLTGQPQPLDLSSASGTGLWNSESKSWDRSLISTLGLQQSQLPAVASPLLPVQWGQRTLLLGAGDGPLGNLGVGATKPGRLAISLGTSGAVRRTLEARRTVPPELFLYSLDGLCWVEGGAISNGSSVLDWLRRQRELSHQELLELASGSPPGAQGLSVYPYFSGERAPFWRPDTRSQIAGWGFSHDFADLVRACLEGVGYCLNRLLRLLEPAQGEPLRCTGGLFASPFWCQLLADISGHPIGVSPVTQATALGAALLTTERYLERSAELPLGEVLHPNLDLHEHYQVLYGQWKACEPNR